MLAVHPHADAVQQLLGFATQLRHVLQWTEEILAAVSLDGQSTIGSRSPRPLPADAAAGHPFSIVDRMTFCVRWKGRTCCLGDTLPFRLLERLAARLNQFFSYPSLLEEVRDGKPMRQIVAISHFRHFASARQIASPSSTSVANRTKCSASISFSSWHL